MGGTGGFISCIVNPITCINNVKVFILGSVEKALVFRHHCLIMFVTAFSSSFSDINRAIELLDALQKSE